jgi:hypothetical protein
MAGNFDRGVAELYKEGHFGWELVGRGLAGWD